MNSELQRDLTRIFNGGPNVWEPTVIADSIVNSMMEGDLPKELYFITVSAGHFFLLYSGYIIADIVERGDSTLINVLNIKTVNIHG